MSASSVVLAIGLACSVLAALMAYAIALDEYTHHFAEKRKANAHAMQTALFTFLFFILLTLVLAFLLPRFV